MKKWRVNLILIFIILFGATIVGRLIYIQILNYHFYKALAQGQQKIFQLTQGDRGEIFFRGGQILATNINRKYLFISPREIEKKPETAKMLSQALNLNEDWILEKTKKDNLFEIIKPKLTEEEISSLKKINLPGVYLQDAVFRYSPQESLASQTVGFLSGFEKGQYGLEGYYDDILQGKKEFQAREGGPWGYLASLGSEKSARGSDLVLTLDYNIQFMAERLLQGAKENLDIEGGQILVIQPTSGKIIALAGFPNFNPNQYEEYARENNFEIFQNGAIQKIFEPGSVFKPITMASALNEEKITPFTTYIDTGEVKIGGYTIYNYDKRTWGQRSMTEVLEKSINTGAVFAERQLGHNLFLEYIERFGFFEKTGIDLQGEVFSENKELKKGYEINFATASFGQGIEMTPIQLAGAFSVIANGGKLVRPYVVEKIFENGNLIETQPEIQQDSVISPQTASKLTAMLVSVTEHGFGKAAKIPGYYIAGKTGTAQIAFSALGIDKPGYSEKTIQTFVGFAPAFSPQFLILIKLDNPKAKTAEYSAVPIFRELAKYIIDLWQIPPDYE